MTGWRSGPFRRITAAPRPGKLPSLLWVRIINWRRGDSHGRLPRSSPRKLCSRCSSGPRCYRVAADRRVDVLSARWLSKQEVKKKQAGNGAGGARIAGPCENACCFGNSPLKTPPSGPCKVPPALIAPAHSASVNSRRGHPGRSFCECRQRVTHMSTVAGDRGTGRSEIRSVR